MKYKKIFALAVVLTLILLTGCADSHNSYSKAGPSSSANLPSATSASNSPTPAITDERTTASGSTSGTESSEFQFEDRSYVNGAITIQYPQIVNISDKELQNKLNQIIADSALRDLPIIQNDSTLEEYDITSKVTYSNASLISIIFAGYSYYKQAAHPNQFLYTVTIDVKNEQAITIRDLVKIDDKFVSVMITGHYNTMMDYEMTSDIISSIRDYLNDLGTEYWILELKHADTSDCDTASYLTKDALAISVSVPHVMGDHIEILLPYKDLKDFKTDSPLWDVLHP